MTPPPSVQPTGLAEQVATEVREYRAAVLLRTAADRILRCGLFRGQYWPTDPPYRVEYIEGDPCCALGALAISAGIDGPRAADAELDVLPVLILAVGALSEVIGPDPHNPGSPPSVASWNDQPDRDAADVVAALRRAAERLQRPDTGPPDPPHAVQSDPFCVAGPGGPSATTLHQAPGAPTTTSNHQVDSKETRHV